MKVLLTIPILNDKRDIFDKCLMTLATQTFQDFSLMIINNAIEESELCRIRSLVDKIGPEFNIESYREFANLGVAASWNLALIKKYDVTGAIGFDVLLHDSTFLERYLTSFLGSNCCFGQLKTEHLNFWLAKKGVTKRIGYFDENFYPAYYEDNDWVYRMWLAKEDIFNFPDPSHEVEHLGSQTIYGDTKYMNNNHITFRENEKYIIKKWGMVPKPKVFNKCFNTPFNNSSLNQKFWEKDEGRLNKLKWQIN